MQRVRSHFSRRFPDRRSRFLFEARLADGMLRSEHFIGRGAPACSREEDGDPGRAPARCLGGRIRRPQPALVTTEMELRYDGMVTTHRKGHERRLARDRTGQVRMKQSLGLSNCEGVTPIPLRDGGRGAMLVSTRRRTERPREGIRQK